MSFNVPVEVYHEKLSDLSEVPDLQKSLIRRLSIFVTDLDDKVKSLLPAARSDTGVVVIAQTSGTSGPDTGLQAGDIIRTMNHAPLQSISQFQARVHEIRPGDPVVLQVERSGNLQYLAFEME